MPFPTYTLSTNGLYHEAKRSSSGFKTVNFGSIAELESIVKKDWSPCIFEGGTRKKDNFEFSSFLYADVDEGCSIEKFGEIFNEYEYFILTSRNHQKAKPATSTKMESPAQDRYHVLFPLIAPCYDVSELESKLAFLTSNWGFFDSSVKDGARFFFGNDSVQVSYNSGEKHFDILDNSYINMPFEPMKESKDKVILDSLKYAGQQGVLDAYSDWLAVGTALKNEGYSFEDWVYISKDCVDQREMQFKWDSFKKSGTSAGTLVHYGRQANPALLKKGASINHTLANSVYDRTPSAIATKDAREQVIGQINSQISGSSKIAQEFALTQFGTRDRTVYYHGEDIRYVTDRADWMVWSGSHWKSSDGNKVFSMISQTIEKVEARESMFYPYCKAGKNDPPEMQQAAEKYKNFKSYITSSQTNSHVEGTEKLMRNVTEIVTHETQYDNDPMIFNCENGIVDLNTGELLAHDPDLLCSKIGGVKYDKEAKASEFKNMLLDIMCGKQNLVDWLQEYFGYMLTGLPPDRVFAIFWGSGANGKSSLINITSHVLGSYSVVARPETFLQSDNIDKVGQDLVILRGARGIIMQETSEGQKLDAQRIKAFTGKDAIKGRYNFAKQEITFINTGKIILSTNHKPRVNGDDEAMWDRINLIAFLRVFSDAERDVDLPNRIIKNESSGVLNWMIEGCLRLKARGWKFLPTEEIDAAGEEYRKEEDKMSQFVEENCTFAGKEWLGAVPEVEAKLIYTKYKEWADEVGIKPVAQVRFFKELSQGKEWIKKYRTNSALFYTGIRLRGENEEFVSRKEVVSKKDDESEVPF